MKAGKAIPESSSLEFSDKISANNFDQIQKDHYAEYFRITKLRKNSTLTFVAIAITIHQKSGEASFWYVINSSFLFYKQKHVWQLEEPFATITILKELGSTHRRFILLLQTKELISISHGSSTNS